MHLDEGILSRFVGISVIEYNSITSSVRIRPVLTKNNLKCTGYIPFESRS